MQLLKIKQLVKRKLICWYSDIWNVKKTHYFYNSTTQSQTWSNLSTVLPTVLLMKTQQRRLAPKTPKEEPALLEVACFLLPLLHVLTYCVIVWYGSSRKEGAQKGHHHSEKRPIGCPLPTFKFTIPVVWKRQNIHSQTHHTQVAVYLSFCHQAGDTGQYKQEQTAKRAFFIPKHWLHLIMNNALRPLFSVSFSVQNEGMCQKPNA